MLESDIDEFDADALSIASAIGRKLCSDAEWNDRSEASWVGATIIDSKTFPPISEQRKLSGDLYNGSLGIALFLSELSKFDPDPRFLKTASGALAHALAWGERAKDYHPLGAYTGALGLVYVVARLPDAMRRGFPGDAVAHFIEHAKASFTNPERPVLLDFLSGAAGAIPVLLEVHRRNSDRGALEFAVQLGDEICARADWQDSFCTWDPMDASDFRSLPLSGLSHGSAGMAFALLQLFAFTQEKNFLATARGAYAYEDTLFDPVVRNWLDVRFVDSVEEAREARRAIVGWCHGAPGIALSRLAAMQIDTEEAEKHLASARVAMEATIAGLESVIATPSYDATLCHGVSGLVECVATAGRVLEDQRYGDIARASMARLLSQHGRSLTFPSGMSDAGYTPSLMLGQAGVGHALLGLLDSRVVAPILTLS